MRKSRGLTEARPNGTSDGAGPGIPHATSRLSVRARPRHKRRALGLVAAVLVCGTAAGTPATAHGAAATTARSRAGNAQVTCTSDHGALAHRLARRVAGALRERHSTAAVALYDRSSGTSCAYHARTAYDSASVVKATLLGALLRQAKEDHRKLTSREKKLATAMITTSDNDATSTLWREVGRKDVQHFLDLAGMRDTEPGRRGYWGLTQVTARDQLKLLKLLTSGNHVLDAGSRAYELGLMNKVTGSQRWGVPTGAPKDSTVHVKNGWLSRDAHGWRVNSVGAFTGGGHDYGIAVLSQDNKTMAYGVHTVEAASRAVHRELAR
ncbi:class A beta-lactamase-related serine hydrolase [Streptomyces sp. NBC_01795]|uniref:serine hydrolase n=1 Tax=unclassified Streptomyces TaxID=2593676 RepID=UPI002DDBF232|nr:MULTISPECIES: serine hydrolase [unclassified Streptomyces]WSA91154.1 class A beta-lactamase-related serine hydrolase [Streptomyces sp. NBC_01795]WSS16238.1 class A beta-lactamase-related serine hydrolase [Streptomyces sp. NBC_01186]